MTKRNKKYNPHKVSKCRVCNFMAKHLIAYREDWEKSQCFHRSGRPVLLTKSEAKEITYTVMQWDLIVCLIGIDSNGDHYAKIKELPTSAEYFNQDLTSVYYSVRDEMLADFNPNHYVTSGWVLGAHNSLIDFDPLKVLL